MRKERVMYSWIRGAVAVAAYGSESVVTARISELRF